MPSFLHRLRKSSPKTKRFVADGTKNAEHSCVHRKVYFREWTVSLKFTVLIEYTMMLYIKLQKETIF